jgi:Cu/Ag efflux pump CusA
MPRFRGDPAPTEMIETVINLKPRSEWRAGLTVDGLIADLDRALQFPGISNAWTMPIKARTDMLATGIRTPIGIKVLGTDLVEYVWRHARRELQNHAGIYKIRASRQTQQDIERPTIRSGQARGSGPTC